MTTMMSTKENQKDLVTEFTIDLTPAMSEKYKLPQFIGSILNLHGQGGYVYPNLERVEKDEDYLLDWMEHRGLIDKKLDYYLKFKDNFVRLSHFLIGKNISEKYMRCFNLFHGVLFLHDDILDGDHPIGEFRGGYSEVSAANTVFVDILKDKYGRNDEDNFPEVDFPLFKPLCHAFKDFHVQMCKTLPFYNSRRTYFVDGMEAYLSSYIFNYVEPIDQRYSEESGKFWLRCNTGWMAWLEMAALIRDVSVPPLMRKDLYFCRLLVASGDVICAINDVFGASKDLGGGPDSLVMYKHVGKGLSLPEAFKWTVDFLNEQIRDMKLLMNVLRKRYPDPADGDAYCRTLEDFVDGYIIWCSTCPRYGGKTTVTNREVQN